MKDDRTVVFDLETGGLDPLRHPVIQFAAVAVEGPAWREIDSLELKVRFDLATAEPEALKVNSYDAETWKAEAMPESAALELIGAFMRRHATVQKLSRANRPYSIARLCAHNAPFDTSFLTAWFKRANLFLSAGCYEPLDTLSLARWVTLNSPHPPENHKLGSLCTYFGVELDNAHDALADVRATAQLARVLLGRIGA